MIDIKKLEDKDVVFVDKPWTPEEKTEFSKFLKAQKAKQLPLKKTGAKKSRRAKVK